MASITEEIRQNRGNDPYCLMYVSLRTCTFWAQNLDCLSAEIIFLIFSGPRILFCSNGL